MSLFCHSRRGVLRAAAIASLGVVAACHDEKPALHVYRAPPPRPSSATAGAVVRELPIGTVAAETRIEGVTNAATGRPVALEEITDSVEVLTLSARGPQRPRDESAVVQLALRGPTDTVLTLALASPAPSIIAHAFPLPVVAGGAGGIRSGRYTAQVRLMAAGVTLASSLPIYFTVRAGAR